MELTKIIADNIMRLLEENNLTQSDLSTHLDISRQTLSNYLKGISTIDSVRLVKTADFFGVPVSSLLENPRASMTPMLLRSNIRAHDPIGNIESLVFEYLEKYERLSCRFGETSKFLPEQHDLYIDYKGKKLSINQDLPKLPSIKFKMDDALRNEIYHIADYQRRLLGLNDSGAIDLIPALIKRGINLFFIDFNTSNVLGLSICDNTYGCCIFINNNTDIPIERRLFTVAHEFAHIILHRPLFCRENRAPLSSTYSEFIDKMADEFAGRILCPPEVVYPYASHFSAPDATLRSIYPLAIRLKKKLQISLSSLLVSLNRYGIISKSIISEFFRWSNSTGNSHKEPYPISDDKSVSVFFESVRRNHLIDLLSKAHKENPVSAETIAYFLDCDSQTATEVLDDLNNSSDDFEDFV